MPEVNPTLDSVLSQEYWEPIPPLYNFSRRNLFGRLLEISAAHNPGETWSTKMDDSVHEQVCEHLFQAAMQLLQGEPVQQINKGELVGTKDDVRYFLPGNILLIDAEEIEISKVGPIQRSEQVIDNDFELAMSALALFKRSAKLVESQAGESEQVWQPYEATVTRRIDGNVHEYTRRIDLFAVAPARNGRLTSIGLSNLVIASNGDISIDVPKGNFDIPGSVRRSMKCAARVGQTINRSISDRYIDLVRLRSAALCLRGSLEYAPAKRRARSSKTDVLVPSLNSASR